MLTRHSVFFMVVKYIVHNHLLEQYNNKDNYTTHRVNFSSFYKAVLYQNHLLVTRLKPTIF